MTGAKPRCTSKKNGFSKMAGQKVGEKNDQTSLKTENSGMERAMGSR